MISGAVDAGLTATLRLVVRGPGGLVEEIEAVVDTGFNETLTLPSSLTSLLGLPWLGRGRATLGDGSKTSLNYHQASVLWDGRVREIVVLEAEGGPLLGMKLLQGMRLTIDVIDGGGLTIVPLP